jgi:hypothetical protein
MTTEQKKRLLKAKIAVALQDELGRVPELEEIDQLALLTRVMYKAVLGLHFKSLFHKADPMLNTKPAAVTLPQQQVEVRLALIIEPSVLCASHPAADTLPRPGRLCPSPHKRTRSRSALSLFGS